ncbi:hypothetical protein HanRHA438_Chr10g0460741 [Helianthus annuus]|nr:hypothetical protein HanRHA438_Chr10g0460741 [Helianthus annuus]
MCFKSGRCWIRCVQMSLKANVYEYSKMTKSLTMMLFFVLPTYLT